MAKTRKQKRRDRFADMCDELGGPSSKGGQEYRRANRQVEKRKRAQFRSKGNP